MTRMSRRVSVIAALATLCLLPFAGCASPNRSAQEQMEMLEASVKVMRALGVEVYGYAHVPLRAGLQTRTEFGSDGHLALFLRVNPGAAGESVDSD